jgi:hypothetical protein
MPRHLRKIVQTMLGYGNARGVQSEFADYDVYKADTLTLREIGNANRRYTS